MATRTKTANRVLERVLSIVSRENIRLYTIGSYATTLPSSPPIVGPLCSGRLLPQRRRPCSLLRRQHHRSAALHHLHRELCPHPISPPESQLSALRLGRRPRHRRWP